MQGNHRSRYAKQQTLHQILPHGGTLFSLIFVHDWPEHTIPRTKQRQRCQTPDDDQQPEQLPAQDTCLGEYTPHHFGIGAAVSWVSCGPASHEQK